MAEGPIYQEYAYTIWTRYGPMHFYYGNNFPPQPWLDTR